MNMNTDTPRTDDQSVRYYDDATGTRIKYVAAKFACQLERELAQRERERNEARKQLNVWKNEAEVVRVELKKADEALENNIETFLDLREQLSAERTLANRLAKALRELRDAEWLTMPGRANDIVEAALTTLNQQEP